MTVCFAAPVRPEVRPEVHPGVRPEVPHGADAAIRDAGPFDVALIAALHAACFADGLGGTVWSTAEIAEILAFPGTYGLLAGTPDDPAPLGFALARDAADEAEIYSLGVLPAARRGGVGRALLGAALARAAGAGARRLCLEVAEDNMAARELYRGSGFTLVCRHPGYYQRPGQCFGPDSGGYAATALALARDIGPGA